MNSIISYYFKLQSTRFKRLCSDLQLIPIFVLVIGIIIFLAGSSFIFYKTSLAKWIYPLIGLLISFQLNGNSGLYNLRSIFSLSDYKRLKLAQSLLLSLPFALFLVFRSLPFQAICLIFLAAILALVDKVSSLQFKIPTPFYKRPFEFVVGFRKTFLLVALLYFLVFKGIQVGNANLAYASMGFIFLLAVSFFSYPEDEQLVWINNSTTSSFLKNKIWVACLYSSLLAAPLLIACLVYFPNLYSAAIFIFLLGYILLTLIILAKYSSFPNEISLPQAIILGLSFMFPPLLLYTIPSFYRKALKKLEPILQC